MNVTRAAAYLYALASTGVIAFQLALAAGMPWGAYAMGGAFPGQLPPGLRVAAVVQAALIGLTAAIVLARAGVALPRWARASRRLAWLIVAVMALSAVLNLVTPSRTERAIWAPVALGLLTASLVVALGSTSRDRDQAEN